MKVLGEFRRRDGMVERRFTKAERRMLGNLVGGLVDALSQADELASYDDAVLRRLLPTAAPDDPEASAEFATATRDRLAAAKTAGAERLVADLDAAPNGTVRLDEEGAVVWLKALADLRLSLAERVGFDAVHGGRGPQALVYGWLTWLQGSLVEALDPEA